jgi:methyl coenzyme M reductase subunit D
MEAVSRSVKPKKKANVDIKNKEKINLKPQKDIPQSLNLKRKATQRGNAPLKPPTTSGIVITTKAEADKATATAISEVMRSKEPNFIKIRQLKTIQSRITNTDYIKLVEAQKAVAKAIEKVEKAELKATASIRRESNKTKEIGGNNPYKK